MTQRSESIHTLVHTVRTATHHALELRRGLTSTTEWMHTALHRMFEALPDVALAPQTSDRPEPFRYFNLAPYVPAQPSALIPAYVRTERFAGFALLSVERGIVIREERSVFGPPLLRHLDRLDGPALCEALRPWIPNPSPSP